MAEFPGAFPTKQEGGVLVVRENDVLAELCRAVVHRDDVGELIQEATERLQHYFGTASIGLYFVQDGDLVLKGLCVPDRFGNDAVTAIREGYESVSLDDDLPGPRAMRERRTLTLSARDPSLDAGVRRILEMLDVSILLAIPVFAAGDAIGCGIVGVPEAVPLTAADQSLLENALGVLAILHHRDQLQKRDAELERQILETSHMAAVGDLTATVAHEVNNPLGAIEHFAESVLLDDELPDDHREAVEGIRSEAARAGLVVRSLLDFGQGRPRRREAVDVEKAVRHAAELLREPFLDGVAVVVDVDPGTSPAWVDPRSLQQVLHNLLVHARKAMEAVDDGGEIRVEAREADGTVELVVEDQGPPLPPGYDEGAFGPFFPSGQRRHSLGLSLAQQVLRENAGSLRAESWGEPDHDDPARGGARFTVTLPRAEPGAEPPSRETRPDRGFVDLEVLLVEDEELVAEATRKLLERLGCRVTVRASAEAALEEIRQEGTFHVIFSDIRMPGIGGDGLYRTLSEERPDLVERLVLTSGDIVSPEIHRFLDGVARPILQKPYELDELRTTLREVLRTLDGDTTEA